MRVLIADAFEAAGVEGLEALGCDVTVSPTLSGDTLVAAVAEAQPDVLIVRSTKVTEPVIAAASPALRLIVRAGAGYDTIDVPAASRRGVYVANCPGQNSVAVAELAFGLIAALDRNTDATAGNTSATSKTGGTSYVEIAGLRGQAAAAFWQSRRARQVTEDSVDA